MRVRYGEGEGEPHRYGGDTGVREGPGALLQHPYEVVDTDLGMRIRVRVKIGVRARARAGAGVSER